MKKTQEGLKEEYLPKTVSKDFQNLFDEVCNLTRIKAIESSSKKIRPPTSSPEFCRVFFAFLKPNQSDSQRKTTFEKLIIKELDIEYSTFLKWQSNGIPEKGDYSHICFCISAQVHETKVEKHLARFLGEWIDKHDPDIGLLGLVELKEDIRKLRTKYNPPERQYPFAAQIQTLLHPESFERHSVFNEIKKFIDGQNSGYFLIEGGAGMGKSWLIAYAAKNLHDSGLYNCVWHFNELASGLNGSYDLLKSLFSQLNPQYDLTQLEPEYERVLQNDSGYAAFYQTMFDHLNYSEHLEDRPLIILIDALDEVSSFDSSIEAKSNTQFIPQRLPKNIYIILTSRDFSRETFLGNTKKIRLTIRSAFQKKDIEGYIRQQAENNNVKNWIKRQRWEKSADPTEAFVALMFGCSQLTFIYLFFVFRQIEDYTPDSMPQGIEGYYNQQLKRLYGSSPATKSASRNIFDAILQFPPNVSAITIQRYTSLDFDTIYDVCTAASSIRLIEEYENESRLRFYSYFHKSFYDYLEAELHSEERAKRFLNLFNALRQDFEFGQDEFSLLIDGSSNDLINVLFSICDGLNKLGILGSKRHQDFDDLVEIIINTQFLQTASQTHSGSECKDRLEAIQNAYNKHRGENTIDPFLVATKLSMAQNFVVQSASDKILDVLRSLDEDKD